MMVVVVEVEPNDLLRFVASASAKVVSVYSRFKSTAQHFCQSGSVRAVGSKKTVSVYIRRSRLCPTSVGWARSGWNKICRNSEKCIKSVWIESLTDFTPEKWLLIFATLCKFPVFKNHQIIDKWHLMCLITCAWFSDFNANRSHFAQNARADHISPLNWCCISRVIKLAIANQRSVNSKKCDLSSNQCHLFGKEGEFTHAKSTLKIMIIVVVVFVVQ